MQLLDSNSHAFPTEVAVVTDGDGFTVYSFDDSGVPLQCIFSLVPAGAQNVVGATTFFGGKGGTPWVGTLVDGGYITGMLSAIVSGPAFSAVYQPPLQALNDSVNRATLTATSAGGGTSRQIMITITSTSKGKF